MVHHHRQRGEKQRRERDQDRPLPDLVSYWLLAEHLAPGMTTSDAQDILATDGVPGVAAGTPVCIQVVGRSDDPAEDLRLRGCPEERAYRAGEWVAMADFCDTPTPGARHPLARRERPAATRYGWV